MTNPNQLKDTPVSLYNFNKIDFQNETLFFGEGKNTQRFDVLKYAELDKSNDIQQGFDWKHDEIPLNKDKQDHKTVSTEAQKWVIKRTIQKLIFLDSAQGRGPVAIFGQISTLPELESVITTWEYFEGNKHSRTYTEMLRAIYDHPDEVFDESFELDELQELIKPIAKRYDDAYFNVINYIYKTQRGIELSEEEWYKLKSSLILCLIEINALEGLRFYSGFAGIWAMNRSQKIYPGFSENFQFICRDRICLTR